MTLHDLGLGKDFLDMTPTAQEIKENIDQLDINKTEKKFFFQRTPSIKSKDNSQNVGNYLQLIYLIKDMYQEYRNYGVLIVAQQK